MQAFQEAPPVGSPPDQLRKYQSGPWFETQLGISLFLGVTSFLAFCYARTRHRVLYAPRTLLKGFASHEVHEKHSFFGWILPTLRTSEHVVLQLVGLDAVVLLSFLKLGFQFFGICTLFALAILVPINWHENGTIEGVPSTVDRDGVGAFAQDFISLYSSDKKHKILHGSDLYLTSHLIFTYAFSLLALFMLNRTYRNFVHARQLFSLDHAHSIPARTVMITRVPPHLQSEKQLAEYFERIGPSLNVESVNVVRQVGVLGDLLAIRASKLRQLESTWTAYVGNPVKDAPGYEKERETAKIMDDDYQEPADQEEGSEQLVDAEGNGTTESPQAEHDEEAALASRSAPAMYSIPGKKRPMVRPGWFKKKVDALDHYAQEFRSADDKVVQRRKGRFRPTEVAFVTFETLAGAQIAAQAVHYPQTSVMKTALAPEPRDVHWGNVGIPRLSSTARSLLVLVTMIVLLIGWGSPVWFLARLLSYEEIKDTSPWLAKTIDRFPYLRVLVQNSLPSLALIAFNALLPYLLEALCIFQGLRAKSWIEYSLMKKYYIFLMVTVLFIFVSVSTVALAQDLADQPMKLPERLATSLPAARNFYVSYIMLQGLGLMPIQLVQLATIITNLFYRAFITRTPRDHAALNNPPVLNLGVVYPQAILIFTIGLTYSIIMPLILVFTTIYFGMSYLVFKYKLLNVYYRAYESRGQAWPITFSRIAFGLIVFQVFMTGLFLLEKAAALGACMVPLLLGTLFISYKMHSRNKALGHYVNISQAAEVQREGAAGDVERLKKGHPVTLNQANLNRFRYKPKDDNLYLVAQDDRTDYSQPPMSDVFEGVLHTGRRRYGHPALGAFLPSPWLPSPKQKPAQQSSGFKSTDGVVIDLKRRWSVLKKDVKGMAGGDSTPRQRGDSIPSMDDGTRAWRDEASDVAENPAGEAPGSDEEDDDLEDGSKYPTFYPRRRGSNWRDNAQSDGEESEGERTPRV